jgi:Ala-tRNA(Pro) deacylase
MTDRDLYAELERLGIHVEVVKHPAVYTVDESKRLRGELPGGHVKNLLLRNKKDELWLLCALEDTAVDLKALGAKIGSGRLSFANAEQLRSTLGIEAGAVSPLAVVNDSENRVRVVLEERMLACDRLNFHPLRNDATVGIATADFLRFLEARTHPPLKVELDERRSDRRQPLSEAEHVQLGTVLAEDQRSENDRRR